MVHMDLVVAVVAIMVHRVKNYVFLIANTPLHCFNICKVLLHICHFPDLLRVFNDIYGL